MAAARIAGRVTSGNHLRVWGMTQEAWPVMGCIGVAIGWMGYMGTRALFFSPECHLVNRKARCSTVRPEDVATTGEKWASVRAKFIVKDLSTIGVKPLEYKFRN